MGLDLCRNQGVIPEKVLVISQSFLGIGCADYPLFRSLASYYSGISGPRTLISTLNTSTRGKYPEKGVIYP